MLMMRREAARRGPKETARALTEGPKAADQKTHLNSILADREGATPEALLEALRSRLARFNAVLYSIEGGKLLLSHPGYVTQCDPRSVRELLKQWEAQ